MVKLPLDELSRTTFHQLEPLVVTFEKSEPVQGKGTPAKHSKNLQKSMAVFLARRDIAWRIASLALPAIGL